MTLADLLFDTVYEVSQQLDDEQYQDLRSELEYGLLVMTSLFWAVETPFRPDGPSRFWQEVRAIYEARVTGRQAESGIRPQLEQLRALVGPPEPKLTYEGHTIH